MKKRLTSIEKFKIGKSIQGFFLCTKKNLRYTRTSDLFLDIELRDKTGSVSAKVWDKVTKTDLLFEKGDAVAVSGDVESFKDRPQLIIRKIRKATLQYYGRYGFDPTKIVPSSKYDPIKMWKKIELIIDQMSNEYLKELLKIIYKRNKAKILIIPASLELNHCFRSGFLENVLSMAIIAKKISVVYNADKDLLVSGVLLHNIGALKSINSSYEAGSTKEGYLIGYNVLGRDLVKEAISQIKNFPKELSEKIEHIILSKKINFNKINILTPIFKEALLVHLIKNMDSEMNLIDLSYQQDMGKGDFTHSFNYFRAPLLKENEIK
tara:strand:- start:517 stop:1482 length:966 start_codon:yes stop_codon:yes gene_type:complete